jgi:hypothetical protein
LAEKETRLDQTESDCLGEEEELKTQTSDHPEKQKTCYHQKKENDPYETNQDPEDTPIESQEDQNAHHQETRNA